MQIVVVDDQRSVLESLEKGIHWTALGFEQVHFADNARDAKLLLMNFAVDVLLTDIEMPEENGLELTQWVRARYPNLICIFLTSHADFSYARQAVGLEGFDYILQPARFEDIEASLGRAAEKARQNQRVDLLEQTSRLIPEQRDSLLELMLSRALEDKPDEVDALARSLNELLAMDLADPEFWPLRLQILQYRHARGAWSESLMKLAFHNVLEELLEAQGVRAVIGTPEKDVFLVLAAAGRGRLAEEVWRETLGQFVHFLNGSMDFTVEARPQSRPLERLTGAALAALARSRPAGPAAPGLVWAQPESDGEEDTNRARIETAVDYIRKNVTRPLSRAEVAEQVHLNEEYFSRLFRQYTGSTFKDFEIAERLDFAQKKLRYSHLSVSIIASMVGFDNFSHFSKTFKKATGLTPQEYRRKYQAGPARPAARPDPAPEDEKP